MSSGPLEKWALLAEVAGALAVVVTLGFVVAEMRSNTNALQAQTYQALIQELNDYRQFRAEQYADPVARATRAKLAEQGWQALGNDERQLVRLPETILMGVYESAYYANERGVLGEREWARFAVAICRATNVAGDDGFLLPELWEAEGLTPMRELLTPDFVEYIDTEC